MTLYITGIYKKDRTARNSLVAGAQSIGVPRIKNRFRVSGGIVEEIFPVQLKSGKVKVYM